MIARTSAMHYKHTTKRVDEIGRELGVQYLLEGSVRRAANRVRITAQPIQLSDQTHMWAENYDRNTSDVLGVQNEVAVRIAESLKLRLLPEKKSSSKDARRVDPEAHEAYLKGLYFWNMRGREGVEKAIEYFEKAIALDPDYALAYAKLAPVYANEPVYMPLSKADEERADARSRWATGKALALDDTLAEVHLSPCRTFILSISTSRRR